MDVLVIGVCVTGHDILIVGEAHAFQISAAYSLPLIVRQSFTRGKGNADMMHGAGQLRAQGAYLSKLSSQCAGSVAAHVGIQQKALGLSQRILQHSPEAAPLSQLGYHG